MDFQSKIDNIIIKTNLYDGVRENLIQLIDEICILFDSALLEDSLTQIQLSLLYYLANFIGIPQYYDLLAKRTNFNKIEDSYNMLITNSFIRESSLYIDDETKVHYYQKEIYDKFELNSQNRYILSAPTSFGKTFIIYDLIKKMEYKNIVLVFPTIALLSENLERVQGIKNKGKLSEYKVITLTEETPDENNKNILIYTPERLISFLEKTPNYKFDFVFYDEIYKIDESLQIDKDEISEDRESRDIAFRLALQLVLKRTNDILLAGPFLNFENSQSISSFLRDNYIKKLEYTEYYIVKTEREEYYDLKHQQNEVRIRKTDSKYIKILNVLKIYPEPAIIYCFRPYEAENFANKIINNGDNNFIKSNTSNRYQKLMLHLEKTYREDWIIIKALKRGIGIHHGLVPKYIQKEVIKLFNEGILSVLFSTTTITEGVNTTAKTVIVTSNRKGKTELKRFDLLNIMGRAGRFGEHYVGRVVFIDDDNMKTLEKDKDLFEHENYKKNQDKDDLDLFITEEEYLTKNDKELKSKINDDYENSEIPEIIRNKFLTIKPKVKIKYYNHIRDLIRNNQNEIVQRFDSLSVIRKATTDDIEYLMTIIGVVLVDDDKYFKLFKNNTEYDHKPITYKINNYRINGFLGLLNYELGNKKPYDTSIRNAYSDERNLFKYFLIRHIGLIDEIYRIIISERLNIKHDEVRALTSLMSILEYGAITENGRKASDFGVPPKVLDKIDDSTKRVELDEYETIVFEEVKELIS